MEIQTMDMSRYDLVPGTASLGLKWMYKMGITFEARGLNAFKYTYAVIYARNFWLVCK